MTTATAEPGGRPPAPEPLRLVQRFVNTHDREQGRDRFATPAASARWLRDVGLPAGRLNQDDLDRFVALREALRQLLLANNGFPLDDSAFETLNTEAARTHARIHFGTTGVTLVPRARGVDRALGQIVDAVFQGMVNGTWRRLKACRRDVCQWAFYDHSKNASGHWCTMEICGNRTKTRTYWRRHHGPRSLRVRERETLSDDRGSGRAKR